MDLKSHNIVQRWSPEVCKGGRRGEGGGERKGRGKVGVLSVSIGFFKVC